MGEAENWRVLFVKLLNEEDLRSKFKTPPGLHTCFLHSIPADVKHIYLTQGEIPAILLADQGGRVYAQSEVKLEIKFPRSYSYITFRNDVQCNFELPPLQGHFEYDLDVKVEYWWRDGKLHLRATMAHPIYTDIGQAPTPWRLLGEKRVVSEDVLNGLLKLPEANITEFYENIPAEELKKCLMIHVGLRAGIWTGGLQCVAGMLKLAYNIVPLNVNAWGIEITCKRAFENRQDFYRVNQNVQVYYHWAYGTPFLAIVPDNSYLPEETGEHFIPF